MREGSRIARLYNAGFKRYTSKDPVRGNVYEPERINPYIQEGNDPVNHIELVSSFRRKLDTKASPSTKSNINGLALQYPDGRSYTENFFKAVDCSFKIVGNNIDDLLSEADRIYDSIPNEVKIAVGVAGMAVSVYTGNGYA